MEKFLGILQFVVKESDLSFRKFIDSTLSLCLDYIYPLVADVSFAKYINLTENFFFREIKRQKYLYFFVKLNDL